MNWLDIALGVLLGFFLLKGLSRGIVKEVVDISAVIITLILAGRYGNRIGLLVAKEFNWDTNLASLLGFVSIAVAVAILAFAVNFVWTHLGRVTPISFFDKLGGGVFGLAKASILIIILLVILTSLPIEDVDRIVTGSTLAYSYMKVLPVVYDVLGPVWPETWPKLYVTPQGWWIQESRPPLTISGEV